MAIVRQMGEWVASAAAFLGPGGVFLVALADSAFIPMPQGVDALLLAQAVASPHSAYWAAGLGCLGSLAGSAGLYLLARRAGRAMLGARISERGIQRLSGLVGRWGATALIPVAAIPLPLPMKPVVLAAGIFQMPLGWFCLAIGFSRALRYFGIVFLGIRYGDSALDFAAGNLPLVAVGCASLIALFVAVRQLSNRWLNR